MQSCTGQRAVALSIAEAAVPLPHSTVSPKRLATLPAGHFVSTGSIVKTMWLDPGDHAIIEIDALGRIEATISRD